jgi:hypothetical protein
VLATHLDAFARQPDVHRAIAIGAQELGPRRAVASDDSAFGWPKRLR